MIIDITSDHGQIGPLKWINSNQIPEACGDAWLIYWGATRGFPKSHVIAFRSVLLGQAEEVTR